MKLECDVVKDLYTLYKENELSKNVRNAVDQHIKSCGECRQVYQNEKGFSDIIKEDKEEQPPKKLDESIMLKLRLRRVKVLAFIIAAVFILTQYQSYVFSRKSLLSDFQYTAYQINQMYLGLDRIKSDYPGINNFYKNIKSLDDRKSVLMRNLNFVERRRLKESREFMFVNYKITDFLKVLNIRYKQDSWDQRDEKALKLMKEYMDNYLRLIEKETSKLNKIYERGIIGSVEALTIPADIKGISQVCHNINQLSLLYTSYDKLPGEISPIEKSELADRIKYVFGMDDVKVEFPKWADHSLTINTSYEFNIRDREGNIINRGIIDGYTGMIRSVRSGSKTAELEGELINIEYAKQNLLELLKREYGGEFQFGIEYLGINKNFQSNKDIKLYSFKIQPLYKGFKLDRVIKANYDARSGRLYHMWVEGIEYSRYKYMKDPIKNLNTVINIKKEYALEGIGIKRDDKHNYKYLETLIIRSALSGDYVMVHAYESENGSIYVNTATGKQEFTY